MATKSYPWLEQLSQHLDSRGYCTRFSLCAYYSSPPGQVPPLRLTLPPKNYPPTAPYANLSAHFARLVKGGGLRSAIVKMLLYPQARQSIDLKRIALRKKRCHKAAAKLKNLNGNQDSGQSELERQDAIELPTDSESYEDDFEDGDFLHSCDSDPFEYVQFYQNKRNDSMCNSTGTFVDHGTGARRHCSSINLIKLDSLDTDEVLAQNELKKESLVIGSKALRALAHKSLNRNSSVHTSTATLELGTGGSITNCVEEEDEEAEQNGKMQPSFSLQQQSSDASSMYAARLGGAFTACENLASMPDDLSREPGVLEPAHPLPPSPTERHSMPSIFVGNRFNVSKNTEVYVPTWRDRQDMQNQSVDAGQLEEEEELHSSSMDLPAACRTAPDKLQAELLYNYDEVMQNPLKLQREATPFQGHNLNSDKRVSHKSDSPSTGNPKPDSSAAVRSSSTTELCIETNSKKRNPPPERSRDSIRRCISYQFLQMSNRPGPPPPPPRRDKDLHLDTKCRCCESSQCPSPRSSDSGMAGSCTITSPDPPNPDSYFPLTETGQDMLDNVEPERFDVCGMFREKFLTPEATQDEEVEPPEEQAELQQLPEEPTTPTNRKEDSPCISSAQVQVNSRSIFLPSSSSMDETHRNPHSNDLLFSSSSTDRLGQQETFRSGMYAHWWKKERLPPEVVRGIAHAYNKSLTSKDSKDSGSVCSSCYCSLGASGYSEGALYCSICADFYSGSTTSTTNTTTTTASSCCPLCSEDEGMIASSHDSSSLDCPICAGRVASTAEEGKQTEMKRRPGGLETPGVQVAWPAGVCSVHVFRLIVL